VTKHHLNIEFNKLGMVQALLQLVDQKGQSLTQLFPKCSYIDFSHFQQQMASVQLSSNSEDDFRSLAYSLGDGKNGLKARLRWEQVIKELEHRISKAREE
jgi:hypothetical protein